MDREDAHMGTQHGQNLQAGVRPPVQMFVFPVLKIHPVEHSSFYTFSQLLGRQIGLFPCYFNR